MKVRVEDYKKCHSRHPNFFSNTVYHLNYPASSYFISGVSGHCEKGQRMIIIKDHSSVYLVAKDTGILRNHSVGDGLVALVINLAVEDRFLAFNLAGNGHAAV
ncbi:hypothetical protein Peur_032565 [Populus x canadensis]